MCSNVFICTHTLKTKIAIFFCYSCSSPLIWLRSCRFIVWIVRYTKIDTTWKIVLTPTFVCKSKSKAKFYSRWNFFLYGWFTEDGERDQEKWTLFLFAHVTRISFKEEEPRNTISSLWHLWKVNKRFLKKMFKNNLTMHFK